MTASRSNEGDARAFMAVFHHGAFLYHRSELAISYKVIVGDHA